MPTSDHFRPDALASAHAFRAANYTGNTSAVRIVGAIFDARNYTEPTRLHESDLRPEPRAKRIVTVANGLIFAPRDAERVDQRRGGAVWGRLCRRARMSFAGRLLGSAWTPAAVGRPRARRRRVRGSAVG